MWDFDQIEMSGFGNWGRLGPDQPVPLLPLLLPIYVTLLTMVTFRKLAGVAGLVALEPAEKRPRIARTRIPSTWSTLYARMSPKEFRENFRVPRGLFDEIVEAIRADVQAE